MIFFVMIGVFCGCICLKVFCWLVCISVYVLMLVNVVVLVRWYVLKFKISLNIMGYIYVRNDSKIGI